MSVISEFAVVPNRVEAVHRYLLERENGETADELRGMLSPPSLRGGDGSEYVDVLIRGCTKLGVIVQGDGNRLRVADALRTTSIQAATKLRVHLERVLLHPNEAEGADQTEVPRVLAWFLTQDPTRPLEFENVKNRVDEQLGADAGALSLTNPQRFQNFVYWARYLGFAWRYKLDREWVVPDPTAALERHLPQVFPNNDAVPVSEALDRWHAVLPVLDGGEARVELERALHSGGPEPGVLSRSTSLALERLRGRGMLRFDLRSDATVWSLDTWPQRSAVSHLAALRGKRS